MSDATQQVRSLLAITADQLPGGPVVPPQPELLAHRPNPSRRMLLGAGAFVAVVLAIAAPVVAFSNQAGSPRAGADRAGASSPTPPLAAAATTDCGTYILGKGQVVVPTAAVDCLSAAFRTHGAASLTLTWPTTEGDPITDVYHVRPDGFVEIATDSSKDAWAGSSPRLERQTCTAPMSVLGQRLVFASCVPDPATT